MNKATAITTSKTDADYEAEVDFYLTESKRLQQLMAEDRTEIQTLQEETRALLANLMATLQKA
jgi:hypothetical protein